jgi:hypothetical protein
MVVSTTKFNASNLFKFKAFSLSFFLLAFFLSFSLIGCGGGGGSSGNSGGGDDTGGTGGDGGNGEGNGGGNTPALEYTITFLNSNLDIINSIIKQEGSVNITAIANEFSITSAYRANNDTDVINNSFYENYNLTENINFYDIPDFNVTEIRTQEELNATRADLNGTYILLRDIELNSTEAGFEDDNGWLPIGNESNPFTGIFSGSGHNISGLWINATTDYVGLFGYTQYAKIKNIGVETNGEIKGNDRVGGIAGHIESYSSITNSYVSGNVNGIRYGVGGIAGSVAAGSSITNSYFAGNVNGTDRVGGITGWIDGSSIINSSATGSISGTNEVGGIAGYFVASSFITNSYAAGNVIGTGNHVGGIAGSVSDSSITNSYASGNVSGNDYVGGIAGVVDSSSITNSYASGDISGINSVGGIAGYVWWGSTIKNNAAINPSAIGSSDVNRIVGYIDTSPNVLNNFALSSMDGGDNSGSFTNIGSLNYHGTGKDIGNFTMQTTYSSEIIGDGDGGLGWSFHDDNPSAPWTIDENDSYPYFYWQNL